MDKPLDKQYIKATILYQNEETEVLAQFREEQNDIIFDFYSGTGREFFDKVIKWEPRKVIRISRHPWTSIEDGVNK